MTTLHDVYPNLDEEQLREVEETFDRYLLLVWKIFERLEAEGRVDEIQKVRFSQGLHVLTEEERK